MKWRLSCFTVVISLLVVLLSPGVTTLRGSNPPVDDQRPSTSRSRGSSRFTQNHGTEDSFQFSTSTSGEIIRRAGSPLRRSSRLGSSLESSTKATLVARKLTGRVHVASIKPEDIVLTEDIEKKNTARRNTENLKDEVTTRRNGDRRYLPEKRTRVSTEKSFAEVELEAPKQPSRRGTERRVSRSRSGAINGDKTLAQDGPSIFSSTVEYSRSRTGRKIQNPVISRDTESPKADSRRWESSLANPHSRTNARNFDTNTTPESLDNTDVQSGNVRLDIPLSIDQTEASSPSTESTTVEADHREVTLEPSTTRGRGRSWKSLTHDQQNEKPFTESSSTSTARSNVRRGGSRFTEIETESSTPGRVRSSSNRGVESRSRNAGSRSRASQTQSDVAEGSSRSRGGRARGRRLEQVSKIDGDSSIQQEFDSISPRSRGRETDRQSRVVEARPRNPNRSTNRDVQRSSSRFGGRSSDSIDSQTKIETPSTTTTTSTPPPPEIATGEPEIIPKIVELESTVSAETEMVTTATTPIAVTIQKLESTTKVVEVKSETRNTRGKLRSNLGPRPGQGEDNSGDRRLLRKRKSSTTEAGITNRNEFRGRGRTASTTVTVEPKLSTKESRVPNQRRRLSSGSPREESKVVKMSQSSFASPEEGTIFGSVDISSRNIQADDAVLKKIAKVDESYVTSSSTTSTTSLPEIIPKRRGLKRLNIRPKDEKEELSTASSIKSVETLNENGRTRGRGGAGKANRKTENNAAEKPSAEVSEEDNYPPDFKARLAQLKNSEPKVSAGIKSSPRIGIQNFKKPSPIVFSASARANLEKAKKLIKPNIISEDNELSVEQTSVSPSTSPVPHSSPRKSLFGKRPKPTTSSEPKTEEPEESNKQKLPSVRASLGIRPSFGKNRKIEKAEMPTANNKNSRTLPTDDGLEKRNGNSKTRSTKQRASFSKRRNDSTTENIGGIEATVTRSATISVTTSTPLRPDENSVSKYVRGGRISHNDEKGAIPSLEMPAKEELSHLGKPPVVKRLNERSTDLPNDLDSELTTTSKPSARYTRRKSDSKIFRKYDPIPKTLEQPQPTLPAKREFRPRTATYRRHSEAQSPVNPIVPISVAITPKTPKFHATFKSDSTLPKTNAKTFNLQISENSSKDATDTTPLSPNGDNPGSGISGSSNGETGNGATNVFNPTRSLFLINRNTTLLEQLRSTVAPLLSSLGLKSPVFAGAYRNTTSSGNSAIRVTPSGQPPRFSARYKGAELFVRRPSVYQPTIPSIVSSTTPLTPLKVFGVSSPLDVSSPGEPQVLTYYQALETASINNEQQTDLQLPARVGQVDNDNDNDNDRDINDTNNANIDINTAPVVNSRFSETGTSFNTSENTITTEPGMTQNPVTTTVANIDSSETTPNTPQVEANFETTPNSQTTAEAVTESIQTTTSPPPNEATVQSFDITSTTLETVTNSNPTLVPDTTVATDVEESSSAQSIEPFARLLDTSTVSLVSDPNSLENFDTTTTSGSTETQGSSSESFQDIITTPGSADLSVTSTVSSDIPTTEASESTSMPFLQVELQLGDGTSTPSAESLSVDAPSTPAASLSVDSSASTESSEVDVTTTSVTGTPQTTPPILARFSDSETPDVTTVASSTQEPTTPSSLEITALFGVTTNESQVTDQQDTDAATQIIPTNRQNESLELEIATVTSTLPIEQSDTVTTTPATTTQNVQGRVEQGTEIIGETFLSSTDDAFGRLISEPTTVPSEILTTTTESSDSVLSTTVEAPFGQTEIATEASLPSTTVSFENRVGLIPDTVSLTTEPALARITENLETLTTVVPETTTVMINEEVTENSTPQITAEFDSSNSLRMLAGFIDNTATTRTSVEEGLTQTTQSIPLSESTTTITTTTFESTSDTTTTLANIPAIENNSRVSSDSFDFSARLVETTTQDSILTTNSILTTEVSVGGDVTSQTTRENGENGTTELTTNPSIVNEVMTDSMPETSTTPDPTLNLVTDTPTLLARLQDLSAATTATVTAQGTAGADEQATTRPNETSENPETTTIPSITQSPTTSFSQISNDVSTSDSSFPAIATTTIIPESVESTTVSVQMSADLVATTQEIPTTTTASVTQMPTTTTSAPETTLGPTIAATTIVMPETTFGINENLISADPETTSVANDVATEAVASTTDAMQGINEVDPTTTISSAGMVTTQANADATTSSAETTTLAATTLPSPLATTAVESSTAPQVASRAQAIITDTTMTQQILASTPNPRGNLISTTAVSYVGRFGGNRLTPAPRFSSSSSTNAPLRDYHVYGIYPNKTIVRKRPEDNLIDGRNVNSPYVIFGIYPDGKLVRKFPNGTVIPDPPRNPVEVVFSLSTSTTTTNRPSPVFYNQANQGYYNQISPIYNNRPIASIFNQNTNRFGDVNLGLTGNTITGNTGGVSGLSSVGIANRKMSDILLQTQMGTNSNTASEISDLLTTSPNSNTGGSTSTPFNFGGNTNSNLQNGGQITQDRESDEASRTREANGQRSSVYIGQEKFINYWSDGTPNTSPRVLGVRINSVAGSSNVGPSSSVASSLPSFDILPGSQPGNTVTTAPGFPWRDPLDQIFGITTNSPVMTASVATNSLLDNSPTPSISPRPINPFVEVFTPVSSTIDTTFNGITTTSTTTTSSTTTTTTTTPEPTTTTTSTTTMAPTTTTTTTTPAPTTTTTTTTTTTPAPTTTTTTTTTTNGPSQLEITTTIQPTVRNSDSNRPAMGYPQQTPFGNTFDDLAFLNALLQPAVSGSSTPKTLTQAEQFLANKILSLALGNVGPTRSPKAIQPSNASPNSFDFSTGSKSQSKPIIIDLLPPSTTQKPIPVQASTQFTWKPVPVVKTTPKSVTSTQRAIQATWKPAPIVQTTSKESIVASTTPKPVKTTQKPTTTTTKTTTTTPRSRTTTPPPNQGFAAGLLTALFGSNPFAPAPTPAARPAPVAVKKPAGTTARPVETQKTLSTTQKPVQTTAKLSTSRAPARVDSSKIVATNEPPVTNGITVLLNNPNPRVPTVPSSTYSPEEDAKFLAAVLKTLTKPGNGASGNPAPGVSADDEAFLRAILNGQAKVEPASPIAAGSSGGNDAALLAALLKAQGIGPSTPANNLRAQLVSTTLGTPKSTVRTPSSTYPTSIFDTFGSFGNQQGPRDAPSIGSSGEDTVRSQVVGAAIGATKAFSRFLGAAITGAAQQFQSFVRNGTKYVSEAVG